MHIGEKLLIGFFALMGLAFFWLLFVITPVNLATEAECLESGYPKHAVTWNFKRYCMNLEGTVTVKVDQLQ